MRIRLKESITLRSELLAAGAEIDTDELTAQQLISAGQADPVAVNPKKTPKPSEE